MTGKERKQLAKWIFFAMSAHPEIQVYASVDKKSRDKSDQDIGALITRLMTEDCPEQAKEAVQENTLAIQGAFQLVGEVAMQELMSNQDVEVAIVGFEKYLDKSKFNALAEKK